MYEKRIRNKNILKRLIDIVLVCISVTIADVISMKYFDDSFGMQIIFTVVFVAIAVPIDLFFEKKIDSQQAKE